MRRCVVHPAMALAAALAWVTGSAAPVPRNELVASGRNDVVCQGPALYPYEALPLGNGQLGVMVRNAHGLDFLFSHGSFFASADESDWLLSSGEVALHLPESWRQGFVEQRLRLHEARVETVFAAGTVRSWLAEGLDLLVVEIAAKDPLPELSVSVSVWPRAGEQARLPLAVSAGANEIALATAGLSGRRAAAVLVSAPGVGLTSVEREATLRVPGGQRELVLLVAGPCLVAEGATPAAALEEARRVLAAGRNAGLGELRSRHDAFWASFWAKSEVFMTAGDQFPDYLETLYNLFLYAMAGCSRGPEAPKFNGGNYLFANDWRSWGGCYWYQNTRELYWPLLAADAPELWAPFVDLYVRNLPAMREQARASYNAPGACCDETMRRTGGGDKVGNPYTHLYHTTGTELAFQLYTRYLYTGDEADLRQTVYPLMKEVVTFHLSFFHREADGLYHIYPTNARETWWFVRDAITDLVALRRVLPVLIGLSERYGVDAELRATWREVLANLAPYPTDEKAGSFAPCVPLDEYPPTGLPKAEAIYPVAERRSRRAAMNTFNCENCACEPLYPWGLIGLDSPPELLAQMRRTWQTRPFQSWGFGNAWDPSAIWAARLGMGDEAAALLRQFVLNDQFFPCGFFGTPGGKPAEWGKVIGDSAGLDGHGVLATAIQEMQLQSYGGLIRVYPAWPKGWQGRFRLAAEGGFMVSASIAADGTVPQIEVLSRRGGVCRVQSPWAGAASLDGKPADGKEIALQTVAGVTYALRPAQAVAAPALPLPERASGPEWVDHRGKDDTAEAYLARCRAFGFLGLGPGGDNPARRLIERALGTGGEVLAGGIGRPLRPTRRVTRIAAPPAVDGRLDDTCWQERLPFGRFLVLASKELAPEQTLAHAAWDDTALYLAFVCQSSQPESLVADAGTSADPSQLFRDDNVDLFVQPAADQPYWQITVNAAGAQRIGVGARTAVEAGKALTLAAATARQKDAWVLELALPFAELGATPRPGDQWRFNVGRNHAAARQVSTWAPLAKPSLHQPEAFGSLCFSDLGDDAEPILALGFDSPAECGALKNGAALVPGRGGQVLDLKGGAFAEMPPSPSLAAEETLTLAAWVFPRNTGARILDKCTAGTSDGYTLDLHPNNRVRLITPYGTLTSDTAVPSNRWTHVAGVADLPAGQMRIYVNGDLAARGSAAPEVPLAIAVPFRVGADSDASSCLDGQIDEVRVFRQALSEAEIRQLAGGTARP